jgi:hypothetical protein
LIPHDSPSLSIHDASIASEIAHNHFPGPNIGIKSLILLFYLGSAQVVVRDINYGLQYWYADAILCCRQSRRADGNRDSIEEAWFFLHPFISVIILQCYQQPAFVPVCGMSVSGCHFGAVHPFVGGVCLDSRLRCAIFITFICI